MKYLVSFCGYFPSDQPKYSCIVAIQKSGLPASGGGQCGPVFREIAQAVMSEGVYRTPAEGADSTSRFVPDVLYGNAQAASYVLKALDIPYESDFELSETAPIQWTTTRNDGNKVLLIGNKYTQNMVPDVKGMGARDAVYALESRGLKVKLEGRGKVTSQSIQPNTKIIKGQTIKLKLSYK